MLSDALRAQARLLWQAAMPALGPMGAALDAEIRSISGDRGTLLALAYGTLPISDAASVPVPLIDSYGTHALFLRAHSPFCRDIPEEMFLHFVWYPRINSEALTDCRAFFHEKLTPRVAGLDDETAVLEVNRWCAEHMTYQLTDGRTESPLTAYRCGAGRCGEESVFLTTALRSVGIPARQVYVPWWAHCDDNHAWVEAWAGGRWRFLGACESEPVLDRGWFCDAAARAPLVHYRTFFDCHAGDPLTDRQGSARLYSVTNRYAETFRLSIQVVDASGAPAPNASVELDVMNMAAFRPILRNRTDAQGRLTVTPGRCDLHVEAFLDGLSAWADIHPDADDMELRLCLAPPVERSYDCDFAPPPPSARNRVVLTPEQREQGAAVATACAAARAERAKGWNRPEYESAEAPWPRFFALAAGNAPELWKFYVAHEGPERALAAQMLGVLSEKDCRDVRFELLEAHFQSTLRRATARAESNPSITSATPEGPAASSPEQSVPRCHSAQAGNNIRTGTAAPEGSISDFLPKQSALRRENVRANLSVNSIATEGPAASSPEQSVPRCHSAQAGNNIRTGTDAPDGSISDFLPKQSALRRENMRANLSVNSIAMEGSVSCFSPEQSDQVASNSIAAEHFVDAVLNPRIGLEELEDWRSVVLAALAPGRLAEFMAHPESLMAYIRAAFPDPDGNYYPTLSLTPSAMLATGRADERGRQTLFVAILRTLGIPARLDTSDSSARYWRGGAWHPAETLQAASCRLKLTCPAGDRFTYAANWGLSRLEGIHWRTLELPDAPDSFQIALRPGFYRLTTVNRLPNGRQLCRVTDFALAPGQSATLSLELRAAPPEQMLSRIPLDDIWLRDEAGQAVRVQPRPGEIELIAWLRPGEEPTEHILNELLASAEAVNARMESRVALTFVLRDRSSLKSATLRRVLESLPRARALRDSPDASTSGDLARKLFLEPDVLPLAVLLDQNRAARFASAGYQVGLIELTLKLIDTLRQAESAATFCPE